MKRFDTLSPLDFRYYKDELKEFVSEEAAIKYQIQVELALVKALVDRKICDQNVLKEATRGAEKISAEDVYKEEEKIKHNIRALVNCMRKNVSEKSRPFIHLTATSNDIISTSESLRQRDIVLKLIIPELKKLEKTLIDIAIREKDTLQIGRTHGQHAEPITFGYNVAGYISRLGGRIQNLENAANQMRGKFAGAVGAYNASALFFKDAENFEKEVLANLAIKPSTHSTQIVEPEFASDLMHAAVSTFGVLANISDDMRHLQRTEIAEVAEIFDSKQVGSSTMPHKRNPINFENVKSLWKEFTSRMMVNYMDQISEHQRDLTNSASSRFYLESYAGLYIATNRLNRVMSKLVVDKKNLQRNFDISKGKISAEPAYIMLAALGHTDAHEFVKQLTLKADKEGSEFVEVFFGDKEAQKYIEQMSKDQIEIIKNPEKYIGESSKKTEKICQFWKKELKL